MKTIVGHIRTHQNGNQTLLNNHLVIYQLGRRYACEEILKGTPIDSILVTLSLKFIPSHSYAVSVLQQAIGLLSAPRETIKAYQRYLMRMLKDLPTTSLFYQWWQEETEFFQRLYEAEPMNMTAEKSHLKTKKCMVM